jgi:hypothetical protein
VPPRRLARSWLSISASVAFFAGSAAASAPVVVKADAFRVVKSESGPVNYYAVMTEAGTSFLRARYLPPMKTTVVGWQAKSADRRAKRLSWTWRARTLPKGGDNCVKGKGDAAAVVYVTWKRGLKYYVIRYAWSTAGTKGASCGRKRSPFLAQQTVIAESGPPLNDWRTVDVDLHAEFRRHFEGGDATASVPDFVGIGLLTDGDQTNSESSADYGAFTLRR